MDRTGGVANHAGGCRAQEKVAETGFVRTDDNAVHAMLFGIFDNGAIGTALDDL